MLTGDNAAPGFRDHPDKTITIEPRSGTVTVMYEGRMLAQTRDAKLLVEDGHPPVLYIPFVDIDLSGLTRSATETYCPFKGRATYWAEGLPGSPGENLMWSYETPYDEMEAIRAHGAFIEGKVTIQSSPGVRDDMTEAQA